ncbi:unnamed protein product [Rotaria sordida]|uniref:G-protein coupled receptors family 1 profile domain-containing protein n=2 Tax=Rotaria sordida TaxID=392033 RepID=A0A819AE12_9BILA|nr:unnamed protein product [Rotaria sordida]CAF3782880.1 unnamed protein product [Rotaria sordida]
MMSNTRNSSSTIHHFILGTSNPLTTAIWIINERNSTPVNIDVYQSIVRIMWYRFLLIIIIFVTAAGNILVCLAIARERKLQNTTNYFLMSLAIADCLVAILVMPMGMIAEVLGHFPLPHYACIIFATMDVLCCTSSIWHMSTMSMDRYFTIRFPFRYGRNKTRRIMLLKIIAVWAISTAVSSPIFVLGIVDKQNVLSNGVCAPNNASFKLYGSVFAFYIPFIIMITTYALTMRSLRNVLVHKRKYNRERRRKQTFQPLAQLVNQYATIAQNIRRTPSTNNSITNTNINNNNNNSPLINTSYALLTTISPRHSRTQSLLSSNSDLNLKQVSNNIQYSSINMTNRTNINNDFIHHNNQHLTINYTKPSGSKKRHYYYRHQHQQPCTINTGINRTKNEHDMSTVFEITECSKGTSGSYDSTLKTGNHMRQRSNVTNKQKQKQQQALKMIDSIEQQQQQQQMPNTTTITSTVSTVSPPEADICSTTDIDSGPETKELNSTEIIPSTTSIHSTLLNPTESKSLIIPWQDYFTIIQYILQYYLFIHPYRSRPLAIKYKLNENEFNKRSSIVHQSTSTSSVNLIVRKNSQSVSTQTNSLLRLDLSNSHRINNSETNLDNPIKRYKFSFNRSILPSSSLFTKFFRQSSITLLRSRTHSTKSSISLSQLAPATSLSYSIRQQQQQYPYHHCSSNVFRPIEYEMNHILDNDHRPRAASSSVLLHTTYHRKNHTSLYGPRSLQRQQQYQSGSGYSLKYSNPHTLRRQQQPFTSSTNTNSTDSLSVFQRLNSKYFSTISNQQQQQTYSQRLRDEHIVAANERKALKVLLIIFCVFVTLWTPFFICTFISAISEQCRERISSTVWFSITWLGYSSSMANPFIYTIFSDAFRRAFTNIIFCRPSDSSFSKQFSTKLSYQKSAVPHQPIHQQLSYRRNLNYEYSRTSTPISLHPQTSIGGSDATIYINRCISNSLR